MSMRFEVIISVILFCFYTTVNGVPTRYLEPANCIRPLIAGATIMSQPAISDSTKFIVVKRNGVELESGSAYIPGEILTISLSETTNILYLFNVDNGLFKTAGGCEQTRVAATVRNSVPLEMEFIAPVTGSVTISSGWDTSPSLPVKITPTFILSAPTATPSDVPTDVPTDFPSFKPTTNKPTLAPVMLPICQFGGYCASDSDCVSGNKCYIQNQYYSQCIPDSSTYKNGKCKSNWGDKCYSDDECCDPGAICNDASWRQCQQPTVTFPNPAVCRNPLPRLIPIASPVSKPTMVIAPNVAPVKAPIAKPVNKPVSDPTSKPVDKPSDKPVQNQPSMKICQWGGYCRSTSECIAGNVCNVKSKYYSQCLPDKSTYSSSKCVSNWEKCSATSKCCDPGAICSNNLCQQPAIGSKLCSNPTKF